MKDLREVSKVIENSLARVNLSIKKRSTETDMSPENCRAKGRNFNPTKEKFFRSHKAIEWGDMLQVVKEERFNDERKNLLTFVPRYLSAQENDPIILT